MINTIIEGVGVLPPVFYVTGIAVISLIVIMIRMILIIKAPHSEFSMNSVKTLIRGTEFSFVVGVVSLAIGLYTIRQGSYNWWFFVYLCFVTLFCAIKFCGLIINNSVKGKTKKQELRVMIRFIIASLIIVSLAAIIVLLDSLALLFFVLFIVLLLVGVWW